jgi:DNA-directed RNA polymerase subunit RPC12/RpoP
MKQEKGNLRSIVCPKCSKKGHVAEVSIPNEGRMLICPACKHKFLVEKIASLKAGPKENKVQCSKEDCGVLETHDESSREMNHTISSPEEKPSDKREYVPIEKSVPIDSIESKVDIKKGRIIKLEEYKTNILKQLFGAMIILGCVIMIGVSISFCLTIIGAIIGIPMIALFVGIISSTYDLQFSDGTLFSIECPVCQREIQNLSKTKSSYEVKTKCPSCNKEIIVRNDEVLHFQ